MVRALTNDSPATSRRNVYARRIERRVLDYVRRRNVVLPGEHAIVAVSGGPDSSALLAILHRLSSTLDIALIVAHFDHRLRGRDEAEADIAYVRSLTARLRLTMVQGSGDVNARARERGESLEDAARKLRYAFLAREARKAEASVVLTGHTRDDQAETVLLHIVRGSGLDGLAGIRPRAPWPFRNGPELARPLLCLSRADTERYCRELGLEPRHDETNDLLTATRNRIRLRVLPELRAVNPRVAEALARLADAATVDADYLSEMGETQFRALAKSCAGSISLSKAELRTIPQAIATRVVKLALESAAGTGVGFEMNHVEAVLALAGKPPGRLSLPNGVTVQSDSTTIHFRTQPASSQRIPATALAVPGVTDIGSWRIECQVIEKPAAVTPGHPYQAYLDTGLAGAHLTIRSRRPGDRLRPLGLGGEKKVQDILVDAKVPAGQRDAVPILVDDAGIIWVAGHCLDQRAAVKSSSTRVLHVSYERIAQRPLGAGRREGAQSS